MKIAFISFEYAGNTGGGGIGTYVRNTSDMLAGFGHHVHVFTSGASSLVEYNGTNLTITRIVAERRNFPEAVMEVFSAVHGEEPFEIVEGPEYGCDAKFIAERHPEIPFVVRLHGPSFSIARSNAHYVGLRSRARFALGAVRRGIWPRSPWRYDPSSDPERIHALMADEVLANSHATAELCREEWGLPRERLSVVPLPLAPSTGLLALEPMPTSRTVLFLGRLEVRKGVLELAKAIPAVLSKYSDVKFRLVGRVLPHPEDGRLLSDHVRELAGAGARNLEIPGSVPYDTIVEEFSRASICVFPSDWEASGFVCLEGMVAARAVIGSSSGGMAEIIENDRTGLLVRHRDPASIARALIDLLSSPDKCVQMGLAARSSVVKRFSPEAILPLQLAGYERAIANARRRSQSRRYGAA